MISPDVIIPSPLGRIGITLNASSCAVTSLDFLPDTAGLRAPVTAAARKVVRDLELYFEDPNHPFDSPLQLAGTAHQQRVWRALRQVPCGQAWTYGRLAALVGSSPRAVGQACRRNPIPIIVPCHRIVARTGSGGYSGATAGPQLAIKYWLLQHEGVPVPA